MVDLNNQKPRGLRRCPNAMAPFALFLVRIMMKGLSCARFSFIWAPALVRSSMAITPQNVVAALKIPKARH